MFNNAGDLQTWAAHKYGMHIPDAAAQTVFRDLHGKEADTEVRDRLEPFNNRIPRDEAEAQFSEYLDEHGQLPGDNFLDKLGVVTRPVHGDRSYGRKPGTAESREKGYVNEAAIRALEDSRTD